jgi:acetyltransferase
MLSSLFNPKNVAVIGASSKELSIGNRIVKNLVHFGFKGGIFPINPKASEIQGVKAYKSILEIPAKDGVDVVHLVIPAKFSPMAFEDCGKMKVKNIIINSGGFAETGEEGARIERQCLEIAGKYGMRVFGPNCQGIINTDPDSRAYCNFTFTEPETGYVSLVSLSGGVAEMIHQEFTELEIGTRLFASNGNAIDVTIPEIIEFMGNDDGTRAIVTYVEGLRDAKRFLDVASRVAAKKPILAMKAGRTKEGAKAAASHTGGLAREDIFTDLIFKKAGVLSFSDEGQLIRAAAAFASQPVPKGNRVGIITNTGGPAVISTDVMIDGGLELPPLSEKSEASLKEALLPEASVRNPVDLLATATGAHYRVALDAMMADDNFDAVMVHFVTPFFVDNVSIAKEIAEVSSKQIKPVICNLMTDRSRMEEVVEILKAGGVPCFNLPSDAGRAMNAMVAYPKIRSRETGRVKTFKGVDKEKARQILLAAKEAGHENLAAEEVHGILEAYNLPISRCAIAPTADEAVKTAANIGYPVVVKAESREIVHKSDAGGVSLGLHTEEAIRKSIERIQSRIHAKDLRFFVQQYQGSGLEVIMGAKAEDGLGHILMFGLGGIYVEVLKDVTFDLAPLSDIEVSKMIGEIKGAPLLDGVRGQPGVDIGALKEVLQRLSQLVTDLPEIKEMDLNPIIAYEDRVCVVDARINI